MINRRYFREVFSSSRPASGRDPRPAAPVKSRASRSGARAADHNRARQLFREFDLVWPQAWPGLLFEGNQFKRPHVRLRTANLLVLRAGPPQGRPSHMAFPQRVVTKPFPRPDETVLKQRRFSLPIDQRQG